MNYHAQDPQTSREAFARHVALEANKNPNKTNRQKVLNALSQRPGSTAAEIGYRTELGHIEAQRRLSDLKRDGQIIMQGSRKCTYKGSTMSTWWICT